MRILFICQYYAPEPFRHPDYCEELVRLGHEVTVITGLPNYPMGEIYESYRHGEKRDEVINGVKIHRCFTVGRRSGAFFKVLNYFSYAFSSSRYVRKLKNKYDVVLVHQLSPVMMAAAGIKYKKKHHCKLVLYCLDLWPESLIVGGVKRNGLIYRLFHGISKKIYKNADQILVSSKSFAKYFEEEFGIVNTKYLPQYAETIFTPEQCRKKPNGYFDLMFAGNLGTAQSLDTVIEAAKLTRGESIHWHIVGDGSEYQDLIRHSEGLDNVTFYGRQPLGRMPEFYSKADAMIVTMQKDSTLSLTLPGKVQTYMAAGKPIIAAAAGETARVISESGSGISCEPGDPEELAAAAMQMMAADMGEFGKNAVEYYDRFFRKSRFTDALLAALETRE